MSSLREQLKKTRSRMAECHDEIQAIGDLAESENREVTADEVEMIDDRSKEFEKLETSASYLEKAANQFDKVQASKHLEQQISEEDQLMIPGEIGASGQRIDLKYERSRVFASTADAYACGQWLLGLAGNQASRRWALERGMEYRNAMEGETPAAGGYTVPTPLAATIIRLVEEYGVYRRFSRPAVMTSATLDVPKRADGPTVYYPANQGDPITPSDLTFAQVSLLAKKYAQLCVYSTELSEDSVISMSDLIATDMAWNYALAEDTNSFLGDGTATYGGITGIDNALQAGSKLTAGAGLWGGVTLTHLEELAALPPAYGGFTGRWYMSRYAYFKVILALLHAAGGTDMRQIEAGGELMLMGYPVTFTQVLPGKAGATGDMAIVFGDLNLGSYNGTRRQINIRLLTELYAANDQLGIVSTMRADSVIHDVGDATNAGAIVALYLAT